MKYPIIFESYFNRFIKKQIESDFKPNGYLFFRNPGGINEWGEDYFKYFNNIELEYNNAIMFNDRSLFPYMVLNYYSGNFAKPINEYLRGEKKFFSDPITIRIPLIEKEFEKIKRTKENLVVLRRIKNMYLDDEEMKVGKTYFDKAFLSTSLDLSFRKDENGKKSPINNETLLIIKIPKEQKAIYLEPSTINENNNIGREEYELLLPRNLKMVIERKKKIFNNTILVAKVI